MASVGDVITVAKIVYQACESVPAAKKTVKTVGKSMKTLTDVLESMPDEYESSAETLPDAMRRPLISLKENVDKMRKDAERANGMSILGYLARGRGVRDALLQGMHHVQFDTNAMLLAVAEAARQGGRATHDLLVATQKSIGEFERKWKEDEEECRRVNRAEAESQGKRMDEILRLLQSADANADPNTDLPATATPGTRDELAELGIKSQGDLQRAVRELKAEREQLAEDLRTKQAEVNSSAQAKLAQEEILMGQIADALGRVDLRSDNDEDLPPWCICPISMDVMSEPISMDSYDCECEIDHASYRLFMEKGESTDRCPVCGDKLRSDRIKKNPRLRDAIQDAVRRQRGAYDYLPAAAAPSNLFARSRDGGLPTPETSAPPAPPDIYFPSVSKPQPKDSNEDNNDDEEAQKAGKCVNTAANARPTTGNAAVTTPPPLKHVPAPAPAVSDGPNISPNEPTEGGGQNNHKKKRKWTSKIGVTALVIVVGIAVWLGITSSSETPPSPPSATTTTSAGSDPTNPSPPTATTTTSNKEVPAACPTQVKLLPKDGAAYDEFGRSVAIYGDTIVVGAELDDDNGYNSGSAYVFARDSTSGTGWRQQTKLLPKDGAEWDRFGSTVAMYGDTVVVGASADDDNGDYSGSAYTFDFFK
eukprot:CAMPEP_0178623366 /NCGR_PEP_ID=MMETSP0698-20121128/6802_1 /TAXON_ID=265572 /ORGANISM="Extubocellulus spinifer, Strain CCMP396" /LENGTH=648 /DNA_ID=CAMNT_0020262449 /DNA_START=165 /DNA_END=2109 /DNA_ORIENTATION=+